MREYFRNKLVVFLVWLDSIIDSVLEEIDQCYLCTDRAQVRCEDCGLRVCVEHESLFYEDYTLCTGCREKVTPEEQAEMERDSAYFNCEANCHNQGCICTRPHDKHDENCLLCKCDETHECRIDSNCTASGYKEKAAV